MISPTADRVLVLALPPDDTTEGGIILPRSQLHGSFVGEVQAIGPDVQAIKCGDCVLYSEYAGTNVAEGKVIMLEKEILGVVTG